MTSLRKEILTEKFIDDANDARLNDDSKKNLIILCKYVWNAEKKRKQSSRALSLAGL